MFKKKKIVLIGISLAILLFIILQITLLVKEIDRSTPTTLLDNNGKPIVTIQNDWISSNDAPSLMLDYIVKEKIVDHEGEFLFPSKTMKKHLSNFWLDQFYNEDERIELFLNKAYFDNGIVGVDNASNYYFNKSIKETTILEQIFLLYKSKNQETTEMYLDVTAMIEDLYEKGYLEKTEMKESKGKIGKLLESLYHQNTFAQSYVNLVGSELQEKYNLSEEEVFRKGYVVTTGLDRDVQLNLYKKFINGDTFPSEEKTFIEGGMAILRYKTGSVTALMGGREYQESTLNRAVDITRQPASTFKPLIVYGPAIEKGWKEDDVLKDVPIKVGDYIPKNYDNQYRGQVSLQEALVMSYNVPTVWLFNQIGIETGLTYINKFKLFDIDPDDGHKLALGFTRVGTSPLAIAQAYTTFPNGGKMTKAHSIESIKNVNGRTIFQSDVDEKKIYKNETASKVTSILKKVVESGSGSHAAIKGQEIAGKTGTTSYDLWFVGFNDEYVGTVWMGPDEVSAKKRLNINTSSEGHPATLFQEIFKNLE